MSRKETIATEAWRVQVKKGGRVTQEQSAKTGLEAVTIFNDLEKVPGRRYLQRRPAYMSRFETLLTDETL